MESTRTTQASAPSAAASRDGSARDGDVAMSPAIALAHAAGRGDVQATAKLLRELGPPIAYVVRAVLGSGHADVDDAVQQSLIMLVNALPSFRGECEPAGYASRIAVRIAVAARRRARVHSTRTSSVDDSEGDAAELSALSALSGQGAHPSPQEAVASSRRADVIRELLETIPEEQAECLALRVVLGYSLEEVALTCGVPMNTVRSRVRLAKEALRKRIDADPRLADELTGAP